MVSVRQMDLSEVPEDALRVRGAVDHSEYASALNGVEVDKWYEVPLEGVGRRALVRRLNQAAAERPEDQGGPIKLRWAQAKHSKEGVAMFKAVSANGTEGQDTSTEGESDTDGEADAETPAQNTSRRSRRGSNAEAPAEGELVGSGA